jgi:hypothetical protein
MIDVMSLLVWFGPPLLTTDAVLATTVDCKGAIFQNNK